MLKEDEIILIEGAYQMGIELKESQQKDFSRYLELLREENQKVNLTSLETPREIIIKHFLDSFTCLEVINQYAKIKDIELVDIGTGAGFPGLPLKIICPEKIRLFLIEAKGKKVLFLKKLIKELNLEGIQILEGRAETWGRNSEHREKYDIAISRAVAPLNVLAEYSLPLVKIGGWFIAQKGKSYPAEIENSISAINLLGGRLVKVEKAKVPFLNQERFILKFEKIKNTPLKYPRREGIPPKRPLYF